MTSAAANAGNEPSDAEGGGNARGSGARGSCGQTARRPWRRKEHATARVTSPAAGVSSGGEPGNARSARRTHAHRTQEPPRPQRAHIRRSTGMRGQTHETHARGGMQKRSQLVLIAAQHLAHITGINAMSSTQH